MEFQKGPEPAKKVAKSGRVIDFRASRLAVSSQWERTKPFGYRPFCLLRKEEAPKKKLIFYTAFPHLQMNGGCSLTLFRAEKFLGCWLFLPLISSKFIQFFSTASTMSR
jgi:hypothetical protein